MGDIFGGDRSQTSSLETRRGNGVKVQMESLLPDLSKITKAERTEEMALIHVWPCGIKTLPDTNSTHVFRQGLLLK
jgi:hypothetical protein